MSRADLLLDGAEREAVAAYLEPRAAAIDSGALDVRAGVAWLSTTLLEAAAGDEGPNHDLDRVSRVLATAAWSDLATAFSLWCHRMVLEYLARTPESSALRTAVLPRLVRTELIGSTALASGMGYAVMGTPLPVVADARDGRIWVRGSVPWASNLFTPDFVLVTAAATSDGPIVLALPGDERAITVAPPARLLALDATRSSSLTIAGAAVSDDWVVADDFMAFIRRVRPVFLILQTSFALGLAMRALTEAAGGLRGPNVVLSPDVAALEAVADRLVDSLRAAAHRRGDGWAIGDLVRLRYESACLATNAVALEAKTQGGRGYLATSGTARRLREAAFLPVQSPTEGQLRWELQHCA